MIPPYVVCTPTEVGPRGAFYQVTAPNHLMWVATHTYEKDGVWLPKTPPGTYTCRRGSHTIPTGETFDTFEVMDVPGHTGILFVHPGNEPQKDSDGCYLCGGSLGYVNGNRAVIMSRQTFEKVFEMALDGVDEFTLEIKA